MELSSRRDQVVVVAGEPQPGGLQQQQEQLKASVAPELNLQALDWEPSPEVVEQGSWLLRIGVEPQRADDLLGLAAIKPWTLQLGAASGLGLATGQAASHQVAAICTSVAARSNHCSSSSKVATTAGKGTRAPTPASLGAQPAHRSTPTSTRALALALRHGAPALLPKPAGQAPQGQNQQRPDIQAWGNAPARPIIEAVKRQFDPLQQLSRGRLPGVQAALTT